MRWRAAARLPSRLRGLAALIVGVSLLHWLRAILALELPKAAPLSTRGTEPASASTSPQLLLVSQQPHLPEPRSNNLTVAYCTFPENRTHLYPPLHAQWLAQFVAPFIKPHLKLIMRPVLSHIKLLPRGVNATSAQGLDLLGLSNAHIRICSIASREMIRTLSAVPGHELRSIATAPYVERFKSQRGSDFLQGWSHNHRLHWPSSVSVVMDKGTGRLAGPLFTRQSHEGWEEGAAGALVQFDTKLELLSPVSLSAYLPFIVDSFSWRYSPDGSKLEHRFAKLLDSGFTHLEQVVARSAGFNATWHRLQKQYFIAMVNSNCEAGTGMPVVRELFGYAVYSTLGKPVHNIGSCPHNPDGATRAGLTVAQRSNVRSQFRHASVTEMFEAHKFAIVFENTLTKGYITEKIVNAYMGHAVPVYWGGALNKSDIGNVLNPSAYIHCYIPARKSLLLGYAKELCSDLAPRSALKDPACFASVQAAVDKELAPYFSACAREIARVDANDALYDFMLGQPLAPVQDGKLSGVWDPAPLGRILGDLLDLFGYL